MVIRKPKCVQKTARIPFTHPLVSEVKTNEHIKDTAFAFDDMLLVNTIIGFGVLSPLPRFDRQRNPNRICWNGTFDISSKRVGERATIQHSSGQMTGNNAVDCTKCQDTMFRNE